MRRLSPDQTVEAHTAPLRAGVVLIIAGIAFKIGAAPFQIWVPDVYHGSPMPITAFLAVSSKAAGFFVLLNLVNGPFWGMSEFLIPLLGFVATFAEERPDASLHRW